MLHRDSAVLQPEASFHLKEAEGNYALAVTTTFTLEPDPFAVQTDTGDQSSALLVRLGRRTLLRITDRLEAGSTLRVEPLTGLVSGENEIYLEAHPPLDQFGKSHAVRVQILQDNQLIAEETFWSSPGGRVTGTFRFNLAAAREQDEDHDHP
jgi:hypothetical protein